MLNFGLFRTLLFACVTTFWGCAGISPTYFVSQIDSLAQVDATLKKNYILLPGVKGIDSNDIQFQEYAKYIDSILTDRGS